MYPETPYESRFFSVLLALLGLLAVLAMLLILSKRVVRPMAESYEKQTQFITDAGHELKTPMTITSAYADLAEMVCGENRWISHICRQAHRRTDGVASGKVGKNHCPYGVQHLRPAH